MVEVTSLRRSGISDLFGLWAELTMGLEGVGMLREPTVLVLGLRIDSRSSLSPAPSPTPLGLRLGCVDPGTAGPPERQVNRVLSEEDFCHHFIQFQNGSNSTPQNKLCHLSYRSQSVVSGGGKWRRCAVPCGQRRK